MWPKVQEILLLVLKWSLQFNENLYFLLTCPKFSWLLQLFIQTHQKAATHLPPQIMSTLLLRSGWPGDTVYSAPRSPIPTSTCSSRLNSCRECSQHQDRFIYPFTSLLPVASVQLLLPAKGFTIEKPRLCFKWSHAPVKYFYWTKDTKLGKTARLSH